MQPKISESGQIAEQSAPVVSGHTPTPWHFSDDGWEIYSEPRYQSVAQLLATPEVEANAAFIVRAVNSHEALVKALEIFVEEYTQLVNSGDAGFWDPEKEPKVIAARAALASAREVQS